MMKDRMRRFSFSYLRRSLSEEEASSLDTIQSVDLCNVNSSSLPLMLLAPLISESLDFRPPGSKPNRRTQSTPPCGPIVRWWLYWSVAPDVSGSLLNHSLERLPTGKISHQCEALFVQSLNSSRDNHHEFSTSLLQSRSYVNHSAVISS